MNPQECVWEIRYRVIMKTILQEKVAFVFLGGCFFVCFLGGFFFSVVDFFFGGEGREVCVFFWLFFLGREGAVLFWIDFLGVFLGCFFWGGRVFFLGCFFLGEVGFFG